MAKKYVDSNSIVQVIGNVYNNPSLLSYGDKYTIIEDDFPDQFHRIIFGTIYNLYTLGATNINLTTIQDFLESRPKSKAIFTAQKGDEWLTKASQIAVATSFDYYYQRLKKMTLLRAYDSIGVDITDIYDPFNVLDVKQRQLQEEQLDNSTLEELALKIDNKISAIKAKYVDNYHGEAAQASTGIRDLLAKLKESPDVGIPLYGNLINSVTRGARLRKFYLRSAPTGTGKALLNDSYIPTPFGRKLVKEIKVGDFLFDKNGLPTKVLAVHPQPEPKDVWRVTFTDGRYVDCCGEHLWKIKKREYTWSIKTTEEIYNWSKRLKHGFKNGYAKSCAFGVPLAKAVEYVSQNLLVDPYLMGVFLTKGCTDKYNHLMLWTNDSDLANTIAAMLGKNIVAKYFSDDRWGFFSLTMQRGLLISDVFFGYTDICHENIAQTIPREYLESSIKDRYALLQGICDIGAMVTKDGLIKLRNLSPSLLKDVQELIWSLGFQGKTSIKGCIIDKANFLRNSNKKERIIDHSYMVIPQEYETLGITNIEKLGYKAEMTCFTVDASDHLFLANNFVVTHNTRTMIADACNFACNELYDIKRQVWKPIGVSEPTLYITTEQDIGEIQTMMLSFLSGVEEEHILTANSLTENEEGRIGKAIEILERSPLYVEELPDFSLQDIENAIIKGIRDKDVKYVVLDYIHTSMKILEEITRRSGGVKLREDNILFMISIRLKDICNKYGVFILSATQLNSSYTESDTPDQNLLRGSKSIADKIDVGMVLLPITDKDTKGLEKILAQTGYDTPTLKLSIYKNRRGKYKGIFLWCKANLGICRVEPMFATTYNYQFIPMDDLQIDVEEKLTYDWNF